MHIRSNNREHMIIEQLMRESVLDNLHGTIEGMDGSNLHSYLLILRTRSFWNGKPN